MVFDPVFIFRLHANSFRYKCTKYYNLSVSPYNLALTAHIFCHRKFAVFLLRFEIVNIESFVSVVGGLKQTF